MNAHSTLQSDGRETAFFRKIHIDVVLISNEGCEVHLVGELTYTIFPLAIINFTGTATISGPGDCPHKTVSFNSSSLESLTAVLNSYDPAQLTTVTWSGGSEAVATLLNQPEINKQLVTELRAAFN